MTYFEYYLTLKSPEDIKTIANADIMYARVVNPHRIPIIQQSAEEALKEKVGIVKEMKGGE